MRNLKLTLPKAVSLALKVEVKVETYPRTVSTKTWERREKHQKVLTPWESCSVYGENGSFFWCVYVFRILEI